MKTETRNNDSVTVLFARRKARKLLYSTNFLLTEGVLKDAFFAVRNGYAARLTLSVCYNIKEYAIERIQRKKEVFRMQSNAREKASAKQSGRPVKKREIVICNGPILKSMILYALPLIATNLLQLLFNAADVAVLGIFCEDGDNAVAAVGANGALIQLIINLFVGLSVGTNVLVARCVGSGDEERSQRIVGCSVVTAIVCGFILLFVGFFGARTFLVWMDCDPLVLDMATTYLKIYFLGMPIIMLYNFTTAVMRGVGDTFRPLMYLIVGGAANLVLNIVFVVLFNRAVESVAISTVVSQGISATLALIALSKNKGAAQLKKEHLRFYGKELADMAKVGLPSGLQGCLFSVSNVLVQSSINSFGNVVMSANTIASQYDGLTYQAMYGISLSSTVFVSQNYGAKRFDRVKKSVRSALLLTSAIGLSVGCILASLGKILASFMTDSAEVVEYAAMRMTIISLPYFLCGIQEAFACSLRGLGKSTTSMFVALCGTCLFRIVWLNTLLKKYHTLYMLYFIYPASWLLTALIFIPVYFICRNSAEKKLNAELTENAHLATQEGTQAADESQQNAMQEGTTQAAMQEAETQEVAVAEEIGQTGVSNGETDA